jgi:hypothetical protein
LSPIGGGLKERPARGRARNSVPRMSNRDD